MKYLLLIFLPLLLTDFARGQTDTEIYLADLMIDEHNITVHDLTNISQNPGYDNQPGFTPDGNYLLYSSTRDGDTDIRMYSLSDGENSWLTEVPGGEYSPTVIPDQEYFSAIRLKPNGEQLLWKFSFDGGTPEVLIPGEVIGYHTWLDHTKLYAFILGEPDILAEFDLNTNNKTYLVSNPGRSLHRIPGKIAISFVDKTEQPWLIKSYEPSTGSFNTLTTAPAHSEDMAWTSDGYIIMGSGNSLVIWRPENGWSDPIPVFDARGTITRLAVGPHDERIAVVFEEEPR